jgi:hypothetical protein
MKGVKLMSDEEVEVEGGYTWIRGELRFVPLNPQIVNEDLPCNDFKLKKFGTYAVQEIKPAIKQVKNKPVHKEQTVEFGFPVFPYWLSRYILESIKRCGNISLAYDLLLEDACPDLKRRLKMEEKLRQEK